MFGFKLNKYENFQPLRGHNFKWEKIKVII